jgi:glycosyltransferase involved in cell wall biosynthesis
VDPLTVGFIGGVPGVLGGGGLELQMERTAAALEELGHRVRRVECAPPGTELDVLHGFHAEPALWHLLPHWSRSRCALVCSPVLPIRPRRDERMLRISARLPVVTTARMRREVIARADAVVALTEYERGVLVSVFGAGPARVAVVGNGVDPVPERPPPGGLPTGEFLLMAGTVSARKRQLDVARGLAGRIPVVVAGGIQGDAGERAALEEGLRAAGAVWLGEVRAQPELRALQRAAAAVVLLSEAEAQPLVLLEALAAGTPVVASDLPAHRELRDRHPGWVTLVRGPEDVLPAWRELAGRDRGPAPRIDTWGGVAARLADVYAAAIRRWEGSSDG